MTRRFDRLEDSKKLHMQTLCGIAHFDYNQPTSFTYEQDFQVMRDLRLEHSDAEQLFRRMVFNVIAFNQDGPQVIEEIFNVIQRWPNFAKEAGMPAKQVKEIQQLHLNKTKLN